jgi:predicted TPR repeat methyltransferase
MVTVYYHLFHLALTGNWADKVSRTALQKFEKRRKENRSIAEQDLGSADYALLEFDRLVQTPNDAYATEVRLRVLMDSQFHRRPPDSYASAVVSVD